ncbi:response regulator [Salinimicrobium flavum]|uniref:PleD family two-component system response regulator n=1 Tax=Salinimicrobium flavum TaxID=1737065 RepID=A0ABW5IRT5_9FLAO
MSQNIRILVVDDDSGIGEMLKTLLEFYDFKVVVTEKPEETEELVVKQNIDLVMLDMLISGVNGTDVCARLRKNEETAEVPVLMMSALHDAGKKCREAGANDFIAKPFEMEELIKKIHGMLQQ